MSLAVCLRKIASYGSRNNFKIPRVLAAKALRFVQRVLKIILGVNSNDILPLMVISQARVVVDQA